MTKEELLDTILSMSVGYEGAASKIESRPSDWVTNTPKELCEAFTMADAFREFSKGLVALAEEVRKSPDLETDIVRAAVQFIQALQKPGAGVLLTQALATLRTSVAKLTQEPHP
jgi:hypothetical protein